jgi:outer membrane protein
VKHGLSLRLAAWGLTALALPTAQGGTRTAAGLGTSTVLTLEAAYDRALATDESIGIAYEELRNARLQPLSALTRLGPQLTGSATAGRELTNSGGGSSTIIVSGLQTTTGTTSTGTTGTTGTGTTGSSSPTATSTISTVSIGTATNANGSVSLNLQQPLFDATLFPAYRSAKLSVESSRLTYASTVRDILYGVANDFYEVLKDQQLVVVDREGLDLANGQFNLARAREQAGETISTDTLRAQDTAAQSRQTLVQAENNLILARINLANALSLPNPDRLILAEPASYPSDTGQLEARFAEAMDRREDLRIDALNVGIADETRKTVLAEYAPTLSANLTVTQEFSGGPFGPIAGNDTDVQATINASVPFFTGGQRELDLISARHNIAKAKLTLASLAKTVRTDVATAFLQVKTLESTVAELKIQVDANSRNYQVLERQYEAGLATSLDLQSALRDLNNSRAQLVSNSNDLEVARRDLDRQTAIFQEARVRDATARAGKSGGLLKSTPPARK